MPTYRSKQKVRRLTIEGNEGAILEYVNSSLVVMQNTRSVVEDTWKESWAQYLATSEAQDDTRANQIQTVGNINTNWRHRIDRGKAFEIVETIHSYMMGALFPNDNWFDLIPTEPSNTDVVRVIRKFIQNELEKVDFEIKFDDFVRQLIIVGNSCLFFPWDDENDCVDVEVINVFDCWLDSTCKVHTEADFVRRIIMTKQELREKVNNGEYPLATDYDIDSVHTSKSYNMFDDIRQYQGIQSTSVSEVNEMAEVYEFWGTIIINDEQYDNMVVTFTEQVLLRVEENTYSCGAPVIYSHYIPVVDMVYGIGALQSSLGLIHVLNILTNQRLDGIELTTNPMWTKKPSNTLNSEDVYAEPGRVFEVDDHDDIRPMNPAQWNINLSYQEASYVESSIDKNAATGPLIGAGMGRTGERVTAAEIAAVREAGGNRLTGVHRRLEKRGLQVALEKITKIYRQYKTTASIVRVSSRDSSSYDYFQIDRSDIGEMTVRAKGSDHVIEKRKSMQDIYDFMAAVNQDQELAAMIDKEAVLRRLMRYLPFDDPQEFLKKPKEEAADPMQEIGGKSGANAINQQLQADGGNQLINMLKDSYGRPQTTVEPTSVPVDVNQNLGQLGNVPQ